MQSGDPSATSGSGPRCHHDLWYVATPYVGAVLIAGNIAYPPCLYAPLRATLRGTVDGFYHLLLTFNSILVVIKNMATDQTFGQRIRELRKAKNLTQRELAERVASRLREEDRRGFDVTYLSKIENDKMPPPSTRAIMQLAKELDAHSDELLALAGKAPLDLGQALKESKGARLFYRSAKDLNLSEDDWQEMLEYLMQRRGKK